MLFLNLSFELINGSQVARQYWSPLLYAFVPVPAMSEALGVWIDLSRE